MEACNGTMPLFAVHSTTNSKSTNDPKLKRGPLDLKVKFFPFGEAVQTDLTKLIYLIAEMHISKKMLMKIFQQLKASGREEKASSKGF
ncbi:unnamed protein product [Anisakis simplex]|uniref:Ovule protein n=1 Tax=Anisakis simplex TaxID=6269 RepID=A0A0M3JWN3_ANISI|nr:unnamed protein product [Anisakis simplex]